MLSEACKSCSSALAKYYRKNKIAVKTFDCQHHKEICLPEAVSRNLVCGTEAHVGSQYGEAPRIAVVSLDTGGTSHPLSERRKRIEHNPPDKKLNPHMAGTKQLLQVLLKGQVQTEQVFSYFAMINAAKCAAADGSKDMVPHRLYDTCRPYALEELRILDPDIVVMQGAMARKVLKGGKLDRSAEKFSENDVALIVRGLRLSPPEVARILYAIADEHLRQYSFTSTPAIVLQTPHPSARQGQWQRFQKYVLPLLSVLTFRALKKHGRSR